jgi:lysophospholipase L1-like esterase
MKVHLASEMRKWRFIQSISLICKRTAIIGKKIIKNGWCILFITIIIFLFMAEIITRLAYTFELKSSDVINKGDSLIYMMADVYIMVNSSGRKIYNSFNDEKRSISSSSFNIAVLGDSITQGGSLLPNETYTEQLEKLLSNRSGKIKVYNFGFGGRNSIQELILLQEIIPLYKPNLVITQFFENDLDYVGIQLKENKRLLTEPDDKFILIEDEIIPIFPFLSLNNNFMLFKKSQLARFVTLKMYYLKKKLLVFNRCSNDVERCNFDALREMARLLKKNNIKFIIINVPCAKTPSLSCTEQKVLYSTLRNLTKEERIYYIDLCNYLDANLTTEILLDKSCHYNKKGHETLAKIIYKNLTESHIIT